MSSSPISIYLSGSDSPLAQVCRIRLGVKELARAFGRDLVVVDDPCAADILYYNNPPYAEGFKLREEGRLKEGAKIIINILDIPEHLMANGYCPYTTYSEALSKADGVTCISNYVRSQIHRYWPIPGLSVRTIWNPIKPVTNDIRESNTRPFPYLAMMVGRLRDPNKRTELGINSLIRAGFEESEVAMVGPEYPGWGVNMGLVSDEVLNQLYNSVDYVVCPSHLEGLGLPILEAMAAGAVPIVCQDLTTYQDISLPLNWGNFPNVPSVSNWLMTLRYGKNGELSAAKEQSKLLNTWFGDRYNCKNVAFSIIDYYLDLIDYAGKIEEKTNLTPEEIQEFFDPTQHEQTK
jgi:glycosyltransferase involved in cell wall biosynthesis